MYKQLMKVSRGFRLVYVGMMLIVIGILGGMLGMCLGAGIAGGGGLKAGAGIMIAVAGVMMLLLLGGSLLGFVGRIFCLAVPERAGAAKPMIIVSVILEIASFGLSLVGGIMSFTGKASPSVSMGLNGAQILCSLTSAVLFLLFTKTVAQFVRRGDLADAAMMVLKLWVLVIAIYAGSFVMVLVGGAAGGQGAMAGLACVSLVGMLVAVIIALVALVRYITLLKEMSEATASYARRKRSATRRKRRKVVEEEEDEEEEEDNDEDDDEEYRRRRRRRVDDDEQEEEEDDDDDDDEDDRRRRRCRR